MGRGLIESRLVVPRLSCHSRIVRKHQRSTMSTVATPESSSTPPAVPGGKTPSLTMQIIIRRDLLDVENWPVGPLIAQGSHAATALMHLYKDHQAMRDYTEDWKHMRKVSRQVIYLDLNGRRFLILHLGIGHPSSKHRTNFERTAVY